MVDSSAADKVQTEKSWRFRYHKHFVKMVELSAQSPEAALAVAHGGLDYMYAQFAFLRDDRRYSLHEALESLAGSFATGCIEGQKPKPARFELGVPYAGQLLKGDALLRQIDTWVRRGTIELSCGSAIARVAQTTPWLDLSDQYFVLLGAGSAMGPLSVLLSLGAHVIAVARPEKESPGTWERLFAAARESCGTLYFPLPEGSDPRGMGERELLESAGCSLLTQTPEVKNWLLSVCPGRHLCVGGYAYTPGEQFPRVCLAMDAIIKYLTERRQAAVAFLGTPTDCHLVPYAAHAAAVSAANLHTTRGIGARGAAPLAAATTAMQPARAHVRVLEISRCCSQLENARNAPVWQRVCAALSMGRWCVKNARKLTTESGETLYYCDAYIVAQGPNYALSKRMQHWRCMVAREAGCVVSSNIAPSTATVSVTQNKMVRSPLLAAAASADVVHGFIPALTHPSLDFSLPSLYPSFASFPLSHLPSVPLSRRIQFARAYDSLPSWRPYEIPGPETSNAVMSALLIHDLREPMHAGSPLMPLSNPQLIFSAGAFHGGTWRCAHTFASISEPAVVLYFLRHLVVRYWLLAYNTVQALGWSVVLWRVLAFLSTAHHSQHPSRGGSTGEVLGAAAAAGVAAVAGGAVGDAIDNASPPGGGGEGDSAWAAIGSPLVVFQYLALLEVLHALTGMVRTAWLPTLLQVASRVGCVAVADALSSTHASPAIPIIGVAWGFTEVVRYSWYALNLVGKPPRLHTWLRYSTFLVLYPIGVLGEIQLYRDALPRLWAVPALFNAVSAGAIAQYAILPAYVPGLPFMYAFMLGQRKKALSSTSSSARSSSHGDKEV